MKSLILASTSSYRKALLARTGLVFKVEAPLCDEDSIKKQIPDPTQLATTLAEMKAKSLCLKDAVVIGCDQVLEFEGQAYGKAGNLEAAVKQLQKFSGKTHRLLTATCLQTGDTCIANLHITSLWMRNLSEPQIRKYLLRDQSWDCAGSYKIEESGIMLFEKIETTDWTGIQGLPLLWLTAQLQKLGYEVPA